MSEPKPSKVTCDDILAALHALMSAVAALEEWHRADEPLEGAEFDQDSEEAQVA